MGLSVLTNKLGEFLTAGLSGLLDQTEGTAIERRAHTRLRLRFKALLDSSGQRLQVHGVDLHRAGARVASHQPLPVGALVFFYAQSYGMVAWATVRWCAWNGLSQYHMGLEFRSQLMRTDVGDWQFSYVSSSPADGIRDAA